MSDIIQFSAAKVLVIGDIMLDEYWYGSTDRISPEAPVPVVRLNNSKFRLGGAANVANNLQELGAKVKLIGLSGKDDYADVFLEILKQHNIEHYIVKANDFSSIVKLRIVSRQKQMLRLDREVEDFTLSADDLKSVQEVFANSIQNCQVVVLSDYAKGLLKNPAPFLKATKALGITSIVDPKSLDFSLYNGATIIKPNQKEFEAVVGKCTNVNQISERAQNLLKDIEVDSLVITRGEDGLLVISKDQPVVNVPANSGDVFDVTGAGDTVISVLAASLAVGKPLTEAAKIASVAAGIAVSKFGTTTVSCQEIAKAILNNTPVTTGVVAEDKLKQVIKTCQAKGEKIVFINGCYDLIHFGHIRYLEKGKALGDRLVVGVNSDASVKRLKGDSRPIYTLEQRMEVLAALKAVDWVVSYEENTPGRLVESLSPDILVKSGDNYSSVDEIPAEEGATHVLACGGKLHLIERTNECSSTDALEKLKNDVTI